MLTAVQSEAWHHHGEAPTELHPMKVVDAVPATELPAADDELPADRYTVATHECDTCGARITVRNMVWMRPVADG